jgi:hypothetical protein
MPGEGLTHGPRAKRSARGGYHRFSRIIRHSPRDGFNAYTRSPWGPAVLPPSLAGCVRRIITSLASAPGGQDHTISRPRSAVRRHAKHAADTSRPPHPRLACRDDRAQRPSVVKRDGEIEHQFPKKRSDLFSVERLDGSDRLDRLLQIGFLARRIRGRARA